MKTSTAFYTALLASTVQATPSPQNNDGDSLEACTPYKVLYARGTGEPDENGSLGASLGPALRDAIVGDLGENLVSVVGVEYPADAAGNLNELYSSGPGCKAMAKDALDVLDECPGTQLILTGLNQGAMVVHCTAAQLVEQIVDVAAIVTFGDPFKFMMPHGLPEERFHTYCAQADDICATAAVCAGSGDCASKSSDGRDYSVDADDAAAFIQSAIASE